MLNQPGARADDDPVTQAFVLRKSSLNEEEFNKYISHRLGPSAFGYYSGSNSMDGSYTAGRGNSMTNGASPCAPALCLNVHLPCTTACTPAPLRGHGSPLLACPAMCSALHRLTQHRRILEHGWCIEAASKPYA